MEKVENMQENSRKQKLEAYRKALCLLDSNTKEYLYLYDLTQEYIYLTDKICLKYPLSLAEDGGIPVAQWSEIVYEQDRNRLLEDLRRVKEEKKTLHEMEYRLVDRCGNAVWVCCLGEVERDGDGNPSLVFGSVSELVPGRQVDSLTGLLNVEKFMEDMERCLLETSGYLMVLGIDDLKNINIKNGRTFGNYILQKVAAALDQCADSNTSLYRLESDRFAVNFKEKEKREIRKFNQEFRKQLKKECTVSAGVVFYEPKNGIDAGILYQYAENALDRAKREGKNQMVFFSAADYQKNLNQIELQEEMKAAVQDDCRGFYLCYQPLMDGQKIQIYGAEALLRFNSPTRGIVGPDEFIPLLEQSGLICPVGEWILKTAARQCVQWRRILPDFHINVNISYVQLRQDGIAASVLEILEEEGLPGKALTLELTESMQLQDYMYFNKIFYEWKRHGIRIAIDDFGTGYSSLSYLKRIDIDETKIDKCFISRIQYNAYNFRLLSNMIELAHSASIRVCCEGVETEDELVALNKLNPDVLQGFLFARPYRAEDFETLYIRENSSEYQARIRREEKLRGLVAGEDRASLTKVQKEDLGNIVEGLEELVYISDIKTHDLYYLNAAGRKMTGIYDYRGRKCHEVLQGLDHPCSFCMNLALRTDRFHVWEKESPFLGRRFLMKDRRIAWRGRDVHLGLAIDMTERESIGQQMQNRLEYETMLMGEPKERNALLLSFTSEEILENTELGLWIIRMDPETGYQEMFADRVMRKNLGIDTVLTPEECYAFWYSRISDGYYHYVNQSVSHMVETGKIVQLEYTWNHPVKGLVTVRCLGRRVEDSDGKICLEGYHRLTSEMERPNFMPEGLISEIFEYNKDAHRIYFHTERKLLLGEEKRETDFPECWIRREMVHPRFAGKFREIFSKVQDRAGFHGYEMLLRAADGDYHWFRIRTQALGEGEKDQNMMVVILESIGQERAMELGHGDRQE